MADAQQEFRAAAAGSPPKTAAPQQTGLEVSGLFKSYGENQVLKDVSFRVASGQIFGFVGANGAGKTTTMRIMLGVASADRGQALMDGRPVDDAARREIGYMPEERGLYPRMKVGEQLEYLARLHGLDRSQARAQMEHWTQVLGVQARQGDNVEKLSLGNQQRVQLAAALVHSPRALILDEPFSGLDPVAVEVMSGVLRTQADRGAAIVFSSHQLELVEKNCDVIGIISGGQMVALGTVEQLRAGAYEPHFDLCGSAPALAAARAVAGQLGLDVEELPAAGGAPAVSDFSLSEVPAPAVAAQSAGLRLSGEPDSAAGAQVLRAALDGGTVCQFQAVKPPLSELFKAVIQSSDGKEEQKENSKTEGK